MRGVLSGRVRDTFTSTLCECEEEKNGKNTGSERSRTNAVEIAFTAKSVRVSGVAAVVESVLISWSVFVI